MNCNKCGSELIEGMKFCSECGQKVGIEVETEYQKEDDTLEMMKSIAQTQTKSMSQASVILTNSFPIISLIVLIAGLLGSWLIGIPFGVMSDPFDYVIYTNAVIGLSMLSATIALVFAIFGVRKANYTQDKVLFSKIMMIISALFILIYLIIGVIVVGNSNNYQDSVTTNYVSTEDATTPKEDVTPASTKNEISKSNSNDDKANNSNSSSLKIINLNESITNGALDFTLTSSEWLEEINPPTIDGVYSYMADNEGETYFVIHGKCKSNYATSDYFWGFMKMQLIYDEKFKYTGTANIISADGTDMDSTIKPLQEGDFLIFFSVPDSVKNGTGTLTANIAIGDGEHSIEDDGSNAVGLYQISFAR
jgi:hypothetical protein